MRLSLTEYGMNPGLSMGPNSFTTELKDEIFVFKGFTQSQEFGQWQLSKHSLGSYLINT
jgi:hypothetical protein